MLVEPAFQIPSEKKLIYEELISSGGANVFVLGRNNCAQHVALRFDIAGFIDDFSPTSTFIGKPVYRMDDVPRDRIVVSCAAGSPVGLYERLKSMGFSRIIDYFALIGLAPSLFPDFYFSGVNRNNRKDIDSHSEKYEWLYGRLADDASRGILKKIINFRYWMNLECMKGFRNDIANQYFDDCIVFGSDEVFVDGGGYDGDTSLRFAQRCGPHRAIYCFEPTPHLMVLAKEKLKGLDTVHFVEKGLYSENCSLRFDATQGICSRLCNEGATTIDVVRLDDEVREQVSYIKLDIEGSEFDAICGARVHIQAERPKMAIGVYHDQCDFWRIPEEILRINDSYAIFLRHYTELVYDSVMYFVPR